MSAKKPDDNGTTQALLDAGLLEDGSKPHLSPTQVRMFLNCPAQYYFRYIQKMKTPPKAALILGSAVHVGAEFGNKLKLETRETPPLKECLEAYSAQYDADVPLCEWEPGEDHGKIKDEGVGLVELWHAEVSPGVQPREVERRFRIEMSDFPYDFVGVIDVLDEDGAVRDLKTKKRAPAEAEMTKSLQPVSYALAANMLDGLTQREVIFDYLVRGGPRSSQKLVRQSMTPGKKEADRLLKIIARVGTAIADRNFYPNPTGFLCSPRWCGYWKECHATF